MDPSSEVGYFKGDLPIHHSKFGKKTLVIFYCETKMMLPISQIYTPKP